MKPTLETFEEIFKEANHNKRNVWGIKRFDTLLDKYPEFRKNEEMLHRLGLMYDHVFFKDRAKQKPYEDKAISIYKAILKINPNSYKATWGIGRVWWHRKNKKALPYVLAAYELISKTKDPAAPKGLYTQNVGMIYEMLGDVRKAEQWYKKGIKVTPEDWGVYLNIISFYHRKKTVIKAKPFLPKYEQLLKKEPREFFDTAWGKQVLDLLEGTRKIIKEGA